MFINKGKFHKGKFKFKANTVSRQILFQGKFKFKANLLSRQIYFQGKFIFYLKKIFIFAAYCPPGLYKINDLLKHSY